MHETPSQEIFDTMKEAAMIIWNTYDNEFWYVDEKINKINSIENYQDNAMIFYRMFDWVNQAKFRAIVEDYNDILEYITNNE